MLVGDIAVGEVDLIDLETPDQVREFLFGKDGNPLWIERTSELSRIAASSDVGNLGGCERHDPVGRAFSITDVKVMEIPASCT